MAACTFCARIAAITSAGVSPSAGQPVDVELDAHGEVARPEHRRVADAGHPLQLVEEVDAGVVRQEQRVVIAAPRQ